eukprot:gb/GECH01007884.1/.p1 GENE.gb/GECH01007884.1/~~gb/GECH01007884.1/.p1  ORF type:complete len:433 (+),score=113.63 gb/GECH01007884.1/:1-1299(+)
MSGRQSKCIFIGNIPYDANEEELKIIFREAGPVVKFRLVHDRDTQRPKGYGFCEYEDAPSARCAIRNLHDREVNGRKLRVAFADNERINMPGDGAKRSGRSSGGGGSGSTAGGGGGGGPSGGGGFNGRTATPPTQPPQPPPAANRPAQPSASQWASQDPIAAAINEIPQGQMYEAVAQMKALTQGNPDLVQHLLQQNPVLSLAVLHLLYNLNMVSQAPQPVHYAEQSPRPPSAQQGVPPTQGIPMHQQPQQQPHHQPHHQPQPPHPQHQPQPPHPQHHAPPPQHHPQHPHHQPHQPHPHHHPHPQSQPPPHQPQPQPQHHAPPSQHPGMPGRPSPMPGGQPVHPQQHQQTSPGHVIPGGSQHVPQHGGYPGGNGHGQPQQDPAELVKGLSQEQIKNMLSMTPQQIEGFDPAQKQQIIAIRNYIASFAKKSNH